MPPAIGYLVVADPSGGSCEVLNDLRTWHNLTCRLGDVWVDKIEEPCEALGIDVCGPWTPATDTVRHDGYDDAIDYDSPIPYIGGWDESGKVHTGYDAPLPYDFALPYDGGWGWIDFDADPPWLDTHEAASADFLGFWVEDFDFPAVTKRTAYPSSGPLGGATFSRVIRPHREMAIELLLIAESDAGLRWGFDWLTTKLSGCADCGEMTALVRLSCTDAEHPTEGLWQLRRIALVDPPSDDGSPFNANGCVMRKVSLTLAAGDPCRYKCAFDLITDQSFTVSEECVNPVTFLCPDNPDDYRICAPLPAPGVVSSYDINVLITAGADGMCPVTMTGALNPLFLDCGDPRLEPCLSLTVGGLGPYEKLLVDSTNRRVWWSGPSTRFEWEDGIGFVLLSGDRSPEFLSIAGCDTGWLWITPASLCGLSDESTLTVQAVEKVCT